MTDTEILRGYTEGKLTAEQVQQKLREIGSPLTFNADRCRLTKDQLKDHGLMASGTGSLDPVHIENGELDYAINTVQSDGSTNLIAYVYFCGKKYKVMGKTLVEVSEG